MAPEQLRRTIRSPTLMRLQDSNGYAIGGGRIMSRGRLSNAPSMNCLDMENNNIGIETPNSRPSTPKLFNCRVSFFQYYRKEWI